MDLTDWGIGSSLPGKTQLYFISQEPDFATGSGRPLCGWISRWRLHLELHKPQTLMDDEIQCLLVLRVVERSPKLFDEHLGTLLDHLLCSSLPMLEFMMVQNLIQRLSYLVLISLVIVILALVDVELLIMCYM